MRVGTLANQTVAIVGASSGIGLATARAAVNEGASVIMIGRSPAKLEEAAKGLRARTLAMDMLDWAAVDRTFRSIEVLDHLVVTAAGDEYAVFAPIEETTAEQLERSLDKTRGFVNVMRAAARRVRSSIVLLSGAGAVKAPRGTSLAAAANGGIVSIGRALAVELAPVRVNVVMPGAVDTPHHGVHRDEVRASAVASLPLHRLGQPEEIADAILFAMRSPYMTGHTLVLDGGHLM